MDVIEKLKRMREILAQSGSVEALDEAIAEIEFLRLHAGAVTRGESHADLKARQGLLRLGGA